jgi:hypothetical protein
VGKMCPSNARPGFFGPGQTQCWFPSDVRRKNLMKGTFRKTMRFYFHFGIACLSFDRS